MNFQNFEEALRKYISTKFGHHIQETRQMFHFVQSIAPIQKHDIWKIVGKSMKQEKQKVHDFFHNNWCIQFYDDFKANKGELKSIALNIVSKDQHRQLTKDSLVSQTIKEFANKYPAKFFNQRRMRMFLDYTATNLVKLHGESKPTNETTSQAN
jgi:hypothetical protein